MSSISQLALVTAAQRSRRRNAGNNMSKLLKAEEEGDDFYKTTYGGSTEVFLRKILWTANPKHIDLVYLGWGRRGLKYEIQESFSLGDLLFHDLFFLGGAEVLCDGMYPHLGSVALLLQAQGGKLLRK